MTSDEWEKVQAIFEVALQQAPAERAAFLDDACAGNPAQRSEVASLLEAYAHSDDLLETPLVQAAPHLFLDPGGPLEGRTLGPYLIRHEIGRGGMGVVYLAEDTRLSRRVALKALAPALVEDPARRERLRQEARTAASLSHPGIATVYALEEIDRQLFLACEYVPGQTLRALLESGPFAPEQVVDVALQLARALAAAHAYGVIHRDLKPENVVRTANGTIKILDFGIARSDTFVRSRVTQEGTQLGTPGYMSPEQIRGEEADFKTDLFAFGLLVYEMASGSNPFGAPTSTALIARTLEVDPPPLTSVSSASSAALDRIVKICLQKSPSARYPSTEDLVADLERLRARAVPEVADLKAGAQPPTAFTSARRWWAFHQGLMALLYVLMLFAAWTVRSWLPRPWGMLFLIAVIGCASAATTVRLHLRFTASVYPDELAEQVARAFPWTRTCDAAFAGLFLLAALGIQDQHPEFALLLVGVGIAIAAASLMVEPTTTKAALKAR